MRERERDEQLGDAAPAPDTADSTEAFALAERVGEREQLEFQKPRGPGGPSSIRTCIRLSNLQPKGVDATMNIVFGFISPTTNELTALLDACYLNPTLLRN